jgi:uncharacterized protein (TIGR02271 family)
VHVRKDVVEDRHGLDVPVVRDEVTIDRRPVERRPAEAPFRVEGNTIRIPLREERVVVEKRPVVTEVVTVGKRQVRATEHLSARVRREEVHVGRQDTGELDDAFSGDEPVEGGTMTPGYLNLEPSDHEHDWQGGRCATCGAEV